MGMAFPRNGTAGNGTWREQHHGRAVPSGVALRESGTCGECWHGRMGPASSSAMGSREQHSWERFLEEPWCRRTAPGMVK